MDDMDTLAGPLPAYHCPTPPPLPSTYATRALPPSLGQAEQCGRVVGTNCGSVLVVGLPTLPMLLWERSRSLPTPR